MITSPARRTFRRRIADLRPKTGAAASSRSLSWHLGVATLKVVLPLILATLVMVGWIVHDERQAMEALLVGEAHALADSVALQIDKYFVLSNALSRSSLLRRADIAGFEQQAREVLSGMPEVTLLVSTADGHPLLSVPHVAENSPLWRDQARLVKQTSESDSPVLSDVSADGASEEPHASIETTVRRDGAPNYEMALVLSLGQFEALLESQKLPQGWLSGIVDRNGAFVARLPALAGGTGQLASAEFRHAAEHESNAIVLHNSVDGRQILSAYAPAPNGWMVGVAAGVAQFATGPSVVALTAILAGAALTASLVMSFLGSRRLARQVQDLRAKAEELFARPADAAAPTGVREFDGLLAAMVKASKLLAEQADRQRRAEENLRKSEEHFRLLADSLPQLVWTAGRVGRVDYANAQLKDYGTGELSEADWATMIHPEDRRATAAAWAQASEAGVPYQMEHRLMVIGKGYMWHLSRAVPLLDAHGAVVRWYGATTNIHDQKLREENIKFLMTEVNHRSRNLLAVALAIARRSVTTTSTAREFEQKFSERLLGLIANQDLLIAQNWRGVPLEALVLAQVTLPASECEKRLAVEGPEILLTPTSAQTLGIALRELFNNALNYGAFSNDRGNVAVRWRVAESSVEPVLDLTWREREGPAVNPDPVRGFGSILIERMVAEGLNATSVLAFDIEGVTWRLTTPLSEILTRWGFQTASALSPT